jgi:hypothetical protein
LKDVKGQNKGEEVISIHTIQAYSSNFKEWMNEGVVGYVHSIYQHTINVLTPKGLLSLQDQSTPMSSLSINLKLSSEAFQALDLKVQDPVVINATGIQIKQYHFLLHESESFECVLNPTKGLTPTQKQQLIQDIFDVLDDSEFGKVIRHLILHNPQVLSPLGQHAHLLLKDLDATASIDQWRHSFQQLIGFGPGLTPSGDDFISGVLSAMAFEGPELNQSELYQAIMDTVLLHRHETTFVSSAFLEHATHKKFSQAIHELFHAYAQDQPSKEIIERIRQIGHTSGTDYLSGLVFGLTKGGGV